MTDKEIDPTNTIQLARDVSAAARKHRVRIAVTVEHGDRRFEVEADGRSAAEIARENEQVARLYGEARATDGGSMPAGEVRETADAKASATFAFALGSHVTLATSREAVATLEEQKRKKAEREKDDPDGLRYAIMVNIEPIEEGEVIARSEYLDGTKPQYLVRYRGGDGRQTEQWWAEDALYQPHLEVEA